MEYIGGSGNYHVSKKDQELINLINEAALKVAIKS